MRESTGCPCLSVNSKLNRRKRERENQTPQKECLQIRDNNIPQRVCTPITVGRVNAYQAQKIIKSKTNWMKTGPQKRVASTRPYPEELVGPSPTVSIQVEGVYTKALLDTGAQVTLLYRDFYDRHLSHLPIQKIEELEIWGLGAQSFPYDGYLPIKLTFDPSVAGKTEVFDTLAVVCPRPPGASKMSLIIGTNTDLVRRLLTPLVETSNHQDPNIHPMLKTAYQRLVLEQKTPGEGIGKVWRLGREGVVLQPGEVACLRATVKLTWEQPGPFVMLESDPREDHSGLEVIPEVISIKALKKARGRVPVSVRNPTERPIEIPARMLFQQVPH